MLKTGVFDILVIGGGITGAGIALDAAARGLKVALVEKQDFASGTSSKSTKLIHGGLRYLKNLEWKLVRETGHERRIACANAPHLVYPEHMLLPVVKGGSLSYWAASLGIYIYDRLAGVPSGQRRKMLSAEKTAALEPAFRRDHLLGGALYHEYRTDDARLTVEIMKTAATRGALCLNYCKAVEPLTEGGKLRGFRVHDEINDARFDIQARVVINAAGPWVDDIRKMDGSLSGKRLVLSKGVHLVVPYEKLPVKQSCYLDVFSQKGRMIFVIPRDGCTYIGTTDTFYEDPEHPDITLKDVEYLLNAVNAHFPAYPLKREDITGAWSGVRPLIYEEGKPSTELSRKDELMLSPSGLITIAGGKLTGYRKMAERAVDMAVQKGGLKAGPCITADLRLTGAEIPLPLDKYAYARAEECAQIPHTPQQVKDLVYRYGSETERIIADAYELYNADRQHPDPLAEAELRFCMAEEWVCKPADFYIRRTGMLYFRRHTIPAHRERFGKVYEQVSGFDASQNALFMKEFVSDYDTALIFA
ncbi:MAG: FAD-dependent oxidoreductase [Bacteroidia bacterium]|nr:FAD-dependent oxidoreductase [Bacteroidia bacterium]